LRHRGWRWWPVMGVSYRIALIVDDDFDCINNILLLQRNSPSDADSPTARLFASSVLTHSELYIPEI